VVACSEDDNRRMRRLLMLQVHGFPCDVQAWTGSLRENLLFDRRLFRLWHAGRLRPFLNGSTASIRKLTPTNRTPGAMKRLSQAWSSTSYAE
jgi:hypothetical protein